MRHAVAMLRRVRTPATPTPGPILDLDRVVTHQLSNGLRVRLLEDRNAPTVSYYTFFQVGSRNERLGITGISHLFEHMMFNGAARSPTAARLLRRGEATVTLMTYPREMDNLCAMAPRRSTLRAVTLWVGEPTWRGPTRGRPPGTGSRSARRSRGATVAATCWRSWARRSAPTVTIAG